jgi:hypothetical protein
MRSDDELSWWLLIFAKVFMAEGNWLVVLIKPL